MEIEENVENADANAAAAAVRPIVRVVNCDAIKIERFGDGNFDRWLRRFEVCAKAYGLDADARRLFFGDLPQGPRLGSVRALRGGRNRRLRRPRRRIEKTFWNKHAGEKNARAPASGGAKIPP